VVGFFSHGSGAKTKKFLPFDSGFKTVDELSKNLMRLFHTAKDPHPLFHNPFQSRLQH